MVDLLFHVSLLCANALVIAIGVRLPAPVLRVAGVGFGLAGAGTCLSLVLGVLSGRSGFGAMGFLAWAVFLYAPLSLSVFCYLRRGRPGWDRPLAGLGVVLFALVGAQAFWNEPTWLEVTRTRIPMAKLREPLTVAVLADLQTDEVGEYEQRVFEELAQIDADLIVLPGDYVQLDGRNPRSLDEERRALRDLFLLHDLRPRLGIWAVPGNVDGRGWEAAFEGVPDANLFSTSGLRVRGEVAITGLVLSDSSNRWMRVEGTDPALVHIVLGHQPDFALGEIDADLAVAGHCHGGQVQVPFIGPLLTLSSIPRAWADGLTSLGQGRWLYVSRGVGMERGWAPRLRFLCRPELAVLELVPSGNASAQARIPGEQ